VLNKKLSIAIVVLSCFFSTIVYSYGDPTKPPISLKKYAVESSSQSIKENIKYVVNAIKISTENRLAIINGEKYVVGQKLGASRIKSISLNNVVLTSGKVLSLFENKLNHAMKKGF